MNIFKYIFLAVFCLLTFAMAQDFEKSFLRLPPDAVSRSVGGANPAHTIGAVDVFINPALLSGHLSKSMQFSNIVDLRGFQFSSVALAISLSDRSFAGIGLKGQLNREAPQSDRDNVSISLIEPSQFAVFLAFARKFQSLSIGTALQYYQMRYQRSRVIFSDKVIMVNFGGYYALRSDFQAGFTVQTPVWAKEIPQEITPSGKLAIGVLWRSSISEQFPFKIAVSVNRLNESPLKLGGGLIFTPIVTSSKESSISFRAGFGDLDLNLQTAPDQKVHSFEDPPFFTIGAGVGFKPV